MSLLENLCLPSIPGAETPNPIKAAPIEAAPTETPLAPAPTETPPTPAETSPVPSLDVGSLQFDPEVRVLNEYPNLTKTVQRHLPDVDIVKRGPNKGYASRPYMDSLLTLQEIMVGGKPVPDAIVPGVPK